MNRTPRLIAATVTVALLVAACGDDDDSADTTTAATEAPAPTEAPAVTEAPATTDAPLVTEPVSTEAPTTEAPVSTEPSLGSIVDVATEAGGFTTLLAAAEAAGLVEELSTRQLTLLAPTDEAFAALGQETIDALLADPAQLAAVLRNHLLPVPQDAAAISIFNNVLTVDGGSLDVNVDGETITIGGATVVQADIPADNGVIHVIDVVLVPAPAPAG
ncbi:MAG: fasciclin domain-containing protein [Ilumatobacteraceae bacterium]|jgi:uncharacterized surface protein with fasciclin (FAS1) repeats|nr:fasciclin domain-containing protein [Ilumatobacteraceae bacterium]